MDSDQFWDIMFSGFCSPHRKNYMWNKSYSHMIMTHTLYVF